MSIRSRSYTVSSITTCVLESPGSLSSSSIRVSQNDLGLWWTIIVHLLALQLLLLLLLLQLFLLSLQLLLLLLLLLQLLLLLLQLLLLILQRVPKKVFPL